DRIGGQVTALVTPDSSASHAVLAASMPAMTSFLQEQRAGVQSLALSNPWAGNTGQGNGQNAGQNSGQSGQTHSNGGQGHPQSSGITGAAGIGAVSSSAPAPGWNESSWNGSVSNSVHASIVGALPGALPEQSGSQVSVLA
ncbi:MAG TPA: hypothetical protein VMU62_01130, partial [Acidobacteriaceae bacterium]|nr:hypothetical protein [Acidobacteriaceae bacterium]